MTGLGDTKATLKIDANSKQYVSLFFMCKNFRHNPTVSIVVAMLVHVFGKHP